MLRSISGSKLNTCRGNHIVGLVDGCVNGGTGTSQTEGSSHWLLHQLCARCTGLPNVRNVNSIGKAHMLYGLKLYMMRSQIHE